MTDHGVTSLRESVDALRGGTDLLRRELVATNDRLSRQTRALWWAIAVPGVVMAVVIVVGMVVGLDNRRAIDESNRRWCPMVGLLLPEPGEAPPSTERSRRILAEAKTLYEAFGCGAVAAAARE
ncbi:MAG TPA: hypothetical protein VFM55_18900 [Micromonosporaceae bacterium]|nr:hypothetical protein [Micromonosporaceae bacterium]